MGKPIYSNPELCPECFEKLTNRNWRFHLKNYHGYRYVDDLNGLAPKQERK